MQYLGDDDNRFEIGNNILIIFEYDLFIILFSFDKNSNESKESWLNDGKAGRSIMSRSSNKLIK